MAAVLRLLCAALLLAMTGAPAAGAHTVLTATDPAADAVLTAAPARVNATFNEEIQPTFAAMTVVGPDANLWSSGETTVEGRVVSVALRPLGPAGRYTANYRVTSADGHVVSGSWSFTLSVAGSGQPGPAASAAPQSQSPQSQSTQSQAPPGAGDSGRGPVLPFVLAGAALAAGLAAWLLRRNRP